MTIAMTDRELTIIHRALVEYVKHICLDEDKYLNEIREIDRLIGYSGELEE